MFNLKESNVMNELTFDQLPNAVATMLNKMDLLESRLLQFQSSLTDEGKPMRVKEAAEFLGIPKNTLYMLTSKEKINSYKPAKHLLFLRQELIEWVKKGRQSTVAEIQADARKGVRLGK